MVWIGEPVSLPLLPFPDCAVASQRRHFRVYHQSTVSCSAKWKHWVFICQTFVLKDHVITLIYKHGCYFALTPSCECVLVTWKSTPAHPDCRRFITLPKEMLSYNVRWNKNIKISRILNRGNVFMLLEPHASCFTQSIYTSRTQCKGQYPLLS